MSGLYGNVINRFHEERNFNDDHLIHEGDDITIYYWSDRCCYYVKEVIDQKHILVLPYHVCADHSKEGGIGHQNWMYFKTLKEHNAYLNSFHMKASTGERFKFEENPVEFKPEEWVFRYNHWYRVIDELYGKKLDKKKYERVGNVSFGIREYYYDWQF